MSGFLDEELETENGCTLLSIEGQVIATQDEVQMCLNTVIFSGCHRLPPFPFSVFFQILICVLFIDTLSH